jgi:hypothetical protein
MTSKPRLLYVVTEDWYFVSHRLPLAVAAQENGFEVAVATREGCHGDVIRNAGIRLIPFSLSRRGGEPISEVTALWRLYRHEQPDLVHHVALKPVMFGALAAGCRTRVAVFVVQRGCAHCPTAISLAARATARSNA